MSEDRSQMMFDILLGIQKDLGEIKQELAAQVAAFDRMIALASLFGSKS